ncbi:MAG: UDP-glucose 4-epimerase GalE [Aquincola sp.]|nr:UDP-glucose 4-epimerase GalE [Aquincola sp.]
MQPPSPVVLLTGATGYIGSHTWLCLAAAGFSVVGVDNFANSSPRVLERLGRLLGSTPVFERADVCDAAAMSAVVQRHRVHAVIHFAALKAVGESVHKPLAYYQNNLGGLWATCQALGAPGARCFVFSSSATVYGQPKALPIAEDAPLAATNPYGQTKLMAEQMLADLHRADPTWRVASLRYFNPVGAHESGLIGEDPRGVPNNLMPYVAQVAVGRRARLQVYGDDYDTPDGTGVRDYIHVMDLALAHELALTKPGTGGETRLFNCGYGTGHSVRQVAAAFGKVLNHALPQREKPRRPGDPPALVCDSAKLKRELGWTPKHASIETIVATALNWERETRGGALGKKNAPVSRVVATFGRLKFVSLAFVLGVMGCHKRQNFHNRNWNSCVMHRHAMRTRALRVPT